MKRVISMIGVGLVTAGAIAFAASASPDAAKAAPKAGDVAKGASSVVGVLAADSRFSTLVAAVKAANLAETLSGPGPFTIFAPTNEAFEKLPAGTVEGLLKPEAQAALAALLKDHVVSGSVLAADVSKMNGKTVKTLGGKDLMVEVKNGVVKIAGATVTQVDLKGSNGVVHVIDTVIVQK